MAQFTGLQSVLDAALGEYQSKGFCLTELSDHMLMLHYRGEMVGVFSQSGATVPVIHEVCREHLESLSAS
jgi:hypothetical protein